MRCRNWRLPASRRVRETALQGLRRRKLEEFLERRFPARTATHASDVQTDGHGFLTGEPVPKTGMVVQEESFRSRNTLGRRRLFHFHIQACFPKASPSPFHRPSAFRLPGSAAEQAQTRFPVIHQCSIPRNSSHASRRKSMGVRRLTRRVGPSQPVDTPAVRGPRHSCDPFTRRSICPFALQFPKVLPSEGSTGAGAQRRNGSFSSLFPSYHK
jgi:hypothetical protein